MYDHISPPLPPPVPLVLPTLGPSQVCVLFMVFLINNPWSSVTAAHMCTGLEPSIEAWGTCQQPCPQRRKTLPPSAAIRDNSSPAKGAPHLYWNCDRFHLVQVTSGCASWCVQLPWHVLKSAFYSSPPALSQHVFSLSTLLRRYPALAGARLIEMVRPQLACTVSTVTYTCLWSDISLCSNCSPR